MGVLKDVTISFEKKQNLGNFSNQTMSITVTIPEIKDEELESVTDEIATRIYAKIDEIQAEVSQKQREANGGGKSLVDTNYLD